MARRRGPSIPGGSPSGLIRFGLRCSARQTGESHKRLALRHRAGGHALRARKKSNVGWVSRRRNPTFGGHVPRLSPELSIPPRHAPYFRDFFHASRHSFSQMIANAATNAAIIDSLPINFSIQLRSTRRAMSPGIARTMKMP